MSLISFFKRMDNVSIPYNERILRIESRLTRLEADILDLATAQDIIRNKVLRKIQYKKEEKEEVQTKDLSSRVLLPE